MLKKQIKNRLTSLNFEIRTPYNIYSKRKQIFFFAPATTDMSSYLRTLTRRFSTVKPQSNPFPPPNISALPWLGPTRKGVEKPRVVVLGTGWAACRLMKDIDTKIYDVVCVSPRNHMVFTPLLASTCVGTLEFRSIAEPIANIQPAISTSPGSYFFLAKCSSVDPASHTVLFRHLLYFFFD